MPAFFSLVFDLLGCLFSPPMLLMGLYFGVLFAVPWLLDRSADLVYAVYARIVGLPRPEGGYKAEDTAFGTVLGWFTVLWLVGGVVLFIKLSMDPEFRTWMRATFDF